MGIFYREKTFHAGKKIRKNDCPSEKYACYAPGAIVILYNQISYYNDNVIYNVFTDNLTSQSLSQYITWEKFIVCYY